MKMKREKKIEFNLADYDYMDKMLLEGWIWEMMRRGDYLHEYRKLEKSLAESQEDIENILSLFRKAVVLDLYRMTDIKPSNPTFFLNIEKGNSFVFVPKPEVKYSDITGSLKIKGIRPFEVILYEEYIQDEGRFIMSVDNEGNIYDEHPGVLLLHDLAVQSPENTIYVGVSRKATVKDIEEGLLPLLKKHLATNRSRIRDDKWKYYLICYDLKNKKLAYKTITDMLRNTYTENKNRFDERNIENYYANALKLIHVDYKEYLY